MNISMLKGKIYVFNIILLFYIIILYNYYIIIYNNIFNIDLWKEKDYLIIKEWNICFLLLILKEIILKLINL